MKRTANKLGDDYNCVSTRHRRRCPSPRNRRCSAATNSVTSICSSARSPATIREQVAKIAPSSPNSSRRSRRLPRPAQCFGLKGEISSLLVGFGFVGGDFLSNSLARHSSRTTLPEPSVPRRFCHLRPSGRARSGHRLARYTLARLGVASRRDSCRCFQPWPRAARRFEPVVQPQPLAVGDQAGMRRTDLPAR